MTIQKPAPVHLRSPDEKHPDHQPRHKDLVQIPETINGVVIEFAPGVHNAVEPNLVRALHYCIYRSIVAKNTRSLHKIWISAVADHHNKPSQKNSRHNQRKAVDISRINGMHICDHYKKDHNVTNIVDAIQEKFEVAPQRRENFGPHKKLKHGQFHAVSGHHDHIHLSVD